MNYSPKLIEMLAESWCPNDINIKDCSKEFDCRDGKESTCEKCWIASLDKLEKMGRGE